MIRIQPKNLLIGQSETIEGIELIINSFIPSGNYHIRQTLRANYYFINGKLGRLTNGFVVFENGLYNFLMSH